MVQLAEMVLYACTACLPSSHLGFAATRLPRGPHPLHKGVGRKRRGIDRQHHPHFAVNDPVASTDFFLSGPGFIERCMRKNIPDPHFVRLYRERVEYISWKDSRRKKQGIPCACVTDSVACASLLLEQALPSSCMYSEQTGPVRCVLNAFQYTRFFCLADLSKIPTLSGECKRKHLLQVIYCPGYTVSL